MDLFNKKEIKNLKDRIISLEELNRMRKTEIERILKEIKEPKCFGIGSDLPEDTILGVLARQLRALLNYLKVECKWNYENDSSYMMPPPKQKKVWKILENKGKEISSP